MSKESFDRELKKLQIELCHLQTWVKEKGLRVVVIFEGRDAAGMVIPIQQNSSITEIEMLAAYEPAGASSILQLELRRVPDRRGIGPLLVHAWRFLWNLGAIKFGVIGGPQWRRYF